MMPLGHIKLHINDFFMMHLVKFRSACGFMIPFPPFPQSPQRSGISTGKSKYVSGYGSFSKEDKNRIIIRFIADLCLLTLDHSFCDSIVLHFSLCVNTIDRNQRIGRSNFAVTAASSVRQPIFRATVSLPASPPVILPCRQNSLDYCADVCYNTEGKRMHGADSRLPDRVDRKKAQRRSRAAVYSSLYMH